MSPGFDLRDYQRDDVERIREALFTGKRKRVLFVGVTGQGKTVEACAVIAGYLAERPQGRRVRVLTPTRETADQWVATLARFDVRAGYVLAGQAPDMTAMVQVGTVATASRRDMPVAGLVVVDEAQHAPAPTWRAIVEQYKHAAILGLSGSPWRFDGRPLAEHFDVLVAGPAPSLLAARGHVATPVMYSWPADIKRPTTEGAGYSATVLRDAAGKILVGDLYEHRARLAAGVRTIAFCCTIEHSKEIAAGFNARGVAAEHVDGKMPGAKRDAILARLRSGETQVVSTVAVLTEGFDLPDVRCVILAAPTQSLAKHLQQCGRALRPGATPIIIDHAGNLGLHGSPIVDREWSLEGKASGSRKPGVGRMLTCPSCRRIFPAEGECPCGARLEPKERKALEAVAGQLVPFAQMTDDELWEFLKSKYALRSNDDSRISHAANQFFAMRGREPPGYIGTRALRRMEPAMSDDELWASLLSRRESKTNAAAAFRQKRGYDHPSWDEMKRVSHADAHRRWSIELKKRLAAQPREARLKRVRPAIGGQTAGSHAKRVAGMGVDEKRAIRDKASATRFAGRESISAAAKRIGVSVPTLSKRLQEQGAYDPKRGRNGVERSIVDEAMRRHAEGPPGMEFAYEGAKRHRIKGITLIKWMRQAGIPVKQHNRVKSEDIDRVVAAHPPQMRHTMDRPVGKETVRRAACRIGDVSEHTIYRLLREAGIANPDRAPGIPQWFDPSDIDRVVSEWRKSAFARRSVQVKAAISKRHRGAPSVESEAVRVGLSSSQLRRILQKAGIDTSRGVLPADVDRVVAEHRSKRTK
jgi:DNA repair protein RadD